MSLAFIISVLLVLVWYLSTDGQTPPHRKCQATKVLRPRSAIIVAVIFNFGSIADDP